MIQQIHIWHFELLCMIRSLFLIIMSMAIKTVCWWERPNRKIEKEEMFKFRRRNQLHVQQVDATYIQ